MSQPKRIKVAAPSIDKEELKAVKEVLLSGYYVSGKNVKQFEEDFAKYIGTDYAVAVNSGTAALHLALLASGIERLDEVIVPSLTFFATAEAVMHLGGVPIFCDIDPDTYCMDPKSVAQLITNDTTAIIPVHLYGHPAEMNKLNKMAKHHDLIVIEDCAQAHGAEYKGKKVGGFGYAGCWSFFATKNITTLEGGMITTNCQSLADRARKMRSHGMSDRNTHEWIGYNYRMNEVSGAIGHIQLKKLDMFNGMRNVFSLYLRHHLRDIDWLRIPPVKSCVKHVWFWCPVQVDEEKLGMTTDELRKVLLENGIETRHRYNEPLYKQPALRWIEHGSQIYSKTYLPNVEKIAGKMIGLPNHPKLTRKEVRTIIKVMHEVK